jgi:hypothetical protein
MSASGHQRTTHPRPKAPLVRSYPQKRTLNGSIQRHPPLASQNTNPTLPRFCLEFPLSARAIDALAHGSLRSHGPPMAAAGAAVAVSVAAVVVSVLLRLLRKSVST